MDQRHNIENIALKEVIEEQLKDKKARIKVFDRGITARQTYDDFTDNGMTFVLRFIMTAKHDTVELFDTFATFLMKTATLKITNDDWCQLYEEKRAANIWSRS